MQGGSHMQGYLLKRNKEHRKANLLGSKYKRRWVEVTADTLVYTKSQQDLLTGKIQVFAVQDMYWVRAEADTKFLVKFKERTLTFKVETGDCAERDKWLNALQDCKQQHGEGSGSDTGAINEMEHLKKAAHQQLMEPDSLVSSTPGSMQAYTARSQAPSKTDWSLSASSSVCGGTYVSGSLPPPPVVTSYRTTEAGGQPLSPRSLLASARAGSAFVTNSPRGDGHENSAPLRAGQQGSNAYERQERDNHAAQASSTCDNDSSDDDGPASHIPRGSIRQARNSVELAMAGKPVTSQTAEQSDSQSTVRPVSGSTAGEGARVSSATREKRAQLARRVTPGVMLLNTSEPSTGTQSPSVPSETPRLLRDTVQTGSDEVLTIDGARPQHSPKPASRSSGQAKALEAEASGRSPGSAASHRHQQQQAAVAGGDSSSEGDLADAVLKLDPDEVLSSSLRISGLDVNGNRRPESAPYARPASPRKSILRNGSNAGSMSTPSSSGQLAAAAAAAAMKPSLPAQCMRGAPSRQSTGQQPALQLGQVNKDWLQDDWDGDLEDVSVTVRAGDSSSPAVKAGGVVGVRGSGFGVKADEAWLDDDFDS